MFKQLLTIVFLTLCFSQAGHTYTPKEGNVSAILGPAITQSTFHSGRASVTSPYLGGFGLIAQGDTSDRGTLEISMFHLNKIFYRDQGESFLAEQSQFMHISLGYRYWLTHYLSAGLAFYSAYSMGQPEIVTRSLRPGSDLTTSARDTTEYGFDASIQSELWSRERLAIVLDGRYSYSATPQENEHANQYILILGVRYFIQDKQYVEKPKTSI